MSQPIHRSDADHIIATLALALDSGFTLAINSLYTASVFPSKKDLADAINTAKEELQEHTESWLEITKRELQKHINTSLVKAKEDLN
ncbi:hypothetical protein Dda_8795 [Drechslerella dactyloides]|uniref:Uncharacterized protein n=1 Tax=Drechslerella dactyloides TaxID=74499 RepID=A0AAD6NFL3_DREDA|nr:hypothetical protein Dda_8795 [Drechslerella dactyloides]